jgi:hypothetical protein
MRSSARCDHVDPHGCRKAEVSLTRISRLFCTAVSKCLSTKRVFNELQFRSPPICFDVPAPETFTMPLSTALDVCCLENRLRHPVPQAKWNSPSAWRLPEREWRKAPHPHVDRNLIVALRGA